MEEAVSWRPIRAEVRLQETVPLAVAGPVPHARAARRSTTPAPRAPAVPDHVGRDGTCFASATPEEAEASASSSPIPRTEEQLVPPTTGRKA